MEDLISFYNLAEQNLNSLNILWENNIFVNENDIEIPYNKYENTKTNPTSNQREDFMSDFNPYIYKNYSISNNNNQNNISKSLNIILSESNNKIKEQKNNIQKQKKSILGRKRKNSNVKGFHNNYCKDNIIQRSNCPILSEKNELNNEKDFNKNIGKGKIKKKY